MTEYIKRDAAIREIEQINPVDYGAMWDYEAHHWAGECLRDCKEAIDSIPAADVAPVVHGRWISWEEAGNFVPSPDRHECSVCHDAAQVLVNGFELLSDYCPNCGAKMDGGDNTER